MKNTAVFLFLLAFGLASCNKAGTGGHADLVVFPIHHGVHVPAYSNYPDSVYLFFNSKDLPANPTHSADAIFTGETGEDHVHCNDLRPGNYFLYVAAWDTLHQVRVTGGMAVKIKFKERKQEINVEVPVIE